MPKGYGAGLQTALIYLVNDDGYPTGQVATLNNGSTSNAYYLPDVRTAQIAFADATVVDVTGGDKPRLASFNFGGRQLSQFDIVCPLIDPALVALLSGSTVDTTNQKFEQYSTNTNRDLPRVGGVILQQRFQEKDGGASKIRSLVIPRAELTIKTGGFEFQAPADVTITVNPLMATRSANGIPFSSLGMGLEDNRVDHYEIISGKRLHLVVLRGNGTATTVTGAYRPTSADTSHTNGSNWLAINGVGTALSSVNTATAVFTFSTAPSAGAYAAILYETDFVTP
jgi:hypothetical protein